MDRLPRPSGGQRELELDAAGEEAALELATAPEPRQPAVAPVDHAEAAPHESPRTAAAAAAAHDLSLQRFPERDVAQLAPQRASLLRQVEQRRVRLPVAPTTSVRVDLSYAAWIYPALGLLLLGAATYAFCRYRVAQQQHLFFVGNQPLRTLVMQSRARPGSDDVRRIVLRLATEAGLQLRPDDIEVVVEPLATATHADRLDPEERARAQAFGASWIVGHRTRGTARYGFVTQRFTLERFFYLHDFDAPPTAITPRPSTVPQPTTEAD
ncbi:MAG: hypothetical protein IPG96_11685 [Proteobacteria bacterium]|nr:hypothetical protein [Pseudomonadota bacterium]